jgi:hypothetical protein
MSRWCFMSPSGLRNMAAGFNSHLIEEAYSFNPG